MYNYFDIIIVRVIPKVTNHVLFTVLINTYSIRSDKFHPLACQPFIVQCILCPDRLTCESEMSLPAIIICMD